MYVGGRKGGGEYSESIFLLNSQMVQSLCMSRVWRTHTLVLIRVLQRHTSNANVCVGVWHINVDSFHAANMQVYNC